MGGGGATGGCGWVSRVGLTADMPSLEREGDSTVKNNQWRDDQATLEPMREGGTDKQIKGQENENK